MNEGRRYKLNIKDLGLPCLSSQSSFSAGFEYLNIFVNKVRLLQNFNIKSETNDSLLNHIEYIVRGVINITDKNAFHDYIV